MISTFSNSKKLNVVLVKHAILLQVTISFALQIHEFLSTLYLDMPNSSVLGLWENQNTNSISIILSIVRNMIDRGPKHEHIQHI